MPRPPSPRSPWRTLAVGVVVGVCTIAGIGAYTYSEVRRLRDEQTAISERNRKDSLQLLRIQNDLASLAVLMRDMIDRTEPYPLAGWQPAFDRVREDLAQATQLEQELAPAARDPAQQARLAQSVDAYWRDVTAMFALSRTDEPAARRLVETTLIPQHRAIDGLVSQFLIANNQVQEEAARAGPGHVRPGGHFGQGHARGMGGQDFQDGEPLAERTDDIALSGVHAASPRHA